MSNLLLTQGEVEGKINSNFTKFYADLFGHGPKHIQVNMLPLSAVIVTQNTFTAAELQIMSPAGFHDDSGRQMFKDMRSRIILANRASLIKIIEEATSISVTCLHHDMSALTGEEAFVFSLQDKPDYRANHNGNGHAKGRFVRSFK